MSLSKKTSVPNPAKVFIYISSATVWVTIDLLKVLTILPDITVRRCAVEWADVKPFWNLQKAKFLRVINEHIIYKFLKEFINHKKKTNRVVVFSCRFLPNILKYFMKLAKNQKIKIHSDTNWKTQVIHMKVQVQSSSELPLEH